MEETTRKKLMGKATSDLGRSEKCDKSELINAICRIGISGSAAHDRRRNEVIRAVKTLDRLTEALNCERFELKRSSVYLKLLPLLSFTNLKIQSMLSIHQQSLPVHQSDQ